MWQQMQDRQIKTIRPWLLVKSEEQSPVLGVGSDVKGMSQRPRAGAEPSLGQQETGRAGLQCLLSRKMAGNEACVVGTLLNSRKQS